MNQTTYQQGSPAWLEMRRNYVGGSDAPVLMGESPYKTSYQLWLEKLGYYEQPKTSAMQRGHDLEPLARQKLETYFGIKLQPQVIFHPRIKFMMASMDALSMDGSIAVEIKCTNHINHAKAIAGQIPQQYFGQLQHQMECLELDSMFYYSFDGTDGVIVEVEKDAKYIDRMISEEYAFYDCMTLMEPPSLSIKDYREINDPTWQKWALELMEVKRIRKEAEVREKELTTSLIEMAQDQNSCGAGIKLTKVIRRGSIDYQAIPQLMNVNLNPYRKPSSSYWRIS